MVLGCFPLKSKKKRGGSVSTKRLDLEASKPIALPEPPKAPSRNLQSAPPSFRTRVKPVHSSNGDTSSSSSRARVMSAPSSIHGTAERDLLAGGGVFHEEQQDEQPRDPRSISTKEPTPQPLPLPSPRTGSSLKNWGSFKSFNGSSGRLSSSAVSGPLPLPPSGSVRSFSYDEVVSACSAFATDRCVSEGLSSVMYMASFGDEAAAASTTTNLKKVEATVVRLHVVTQSIREFINEVNTLASLQHQNLCKLVGYHARDGSDTRMLVYERLALGSLDRLLHGRSDGPPLDWNTRMKIALCAAQGLAFLHEEGPFQAMYNEFSTANIQVDKDFSAKLSGYGCVGHAPETETSNSSALANLSVETLERGVLTPKSNVWSYGIVLLEMLTGRKNMDGSYPKEERNLVKWSRAFLADDCRLSLIMDPQLKGRFPAKAARSIADIAQRCLQVEPSERPTMRNIVDQLKIIQDMKYSCRFPLREPAPAGAVRKHMGRSSSLNTIVWTPGVAAAAPRSSFSPSPPARRPSVSPTRGQRGLVVFPPVFPPRVCSSLEEMSREEVRRLSSVSGRRTSLEGF
ncbi:Protein kinase superfamily protein [Raphanus sativus]|uniref:Probable serine/threonine-protein kinase PBL1 n=1 Tax=Raphanus sativus TaxID=3726 RepID=A0A6J0PA68_RAPSA|nr:probable serine/threonine-protein kinase PBL1 [Raphanus sativus]KAJ4893167.1 Protein kinase superfamily protein [Raphanus sativus]